MIKHAKCKICSDLIGLLGVALEFFAGTPLPANHRKVLGAVLAVIKDMNEGPECLHFLSDGGSECFHFLSKAIYLLRYAEISDEDVSSALSSLSSLSIPPATDSISPEYESELMQLMKDIRRPKMNVSEMKEAIERKDALLKRALNALEILGERVSPGLLEDIEEEIEDHKYDYQEEEVS